MGRPVATWAGAAFAAWAPPPPPPPIFCATAILATSFHLCDTAVATPVKTPPLHIHINTSSSTTKKRHVPQIFHKYAINIPHIPQIFHKYSTNIPPPHFLWLLQLNMGQARLWRTWPRPPYTVCGAATACVFVFTPVPPRVWCIEGFPIDYLRI